jgi:hypothetical protein
MELSTFLAYFPKMKEGLSNHQPVCVSPLITFEPICGFSWNLVDRWCHWRWPWCLSFNPIASNHFKMADVWTSEVGAKKPLNNFWTDWWIWMKSCMQVMALKMTSTPYYSIIPNWQTFKLLRWLQLLNRLVDLDEILYGGDGIEYCLL